MSRQSCAACGAEKKHSVVDQYRYAESGLDNIYLCNIEVVSCGCGDSTVLRSHPTLIRVLASCFAYKPARMTGPEVRFVRQVLGKKAKDFAKALSVEPAHLSRIENSAGSVSASLDKLVRANLILDLVESHPSLFGGFDLEKFMDLFERKLPADKGHLGLFVSYTGPYLNADDTRIDFEFKTAA